MVKRVSASLSEVEIRHIAKLAKLHLSKKQVKQFQQDLSSVLGYMQKIKELKTENVVETTQVTGLKNVFRDDKIEKTRMLSQKEALSNAKRQYKGYFLVPAVFD